MTKRGLVMMHIAPTCCIKFLKNFAYFRSLDRICMQKSQAEFLKNSSYCKFHMQHIVQGAGPCCLRCPIDSDVQTFISHRRHQQYSDRTRKFNIQCSNLRCWHQRTGSCACACFSMQQGNSLVVFKPALRLYAESMRYQVCDTAACSVTDMMIYHTIAQHLRVLGHFGRRTT